MALLVYNLTGSPVTLSGLSTVVPASSSPPARGAGVNVTSELRSLSGGQFTALEAQRPSTLEYVWTSAPEYATGTLVTMTAAKDSVATEAALALVDGTLLDEHSEIFVETHKSKWILEKTSAATVAAGTVVAATGGGRWLRSSFAHPYWASQSTWYVDAVSGSDENSGLTSLLPVKTLAEISRRWGKGTYLPGAASSAVLAIQLLSITLLTDIPSTDPLDFNIVLPANALLAIVGTPVTVRTGALTAGTVAKNRATNTPQKVEDTVTPFTSADIGRRIRITSGANSGQFTWGAKDEGAGILRTSSWSTPTMTPSPDCLIQTGLTSGAGVSTDPIVVETLTAVYMRQISVQSPLGGTNTNAVVGFMNLDFQPLGGLLNQIPINSNGVLFTFKGCKFSGQPCVFNTSANRTNFLNCYAAGGYTVLSPIVVRGGLVRGTTTLRGFGVTLFDDDHLVQCVAPLGIISVQSGGCQFGTCAVFDSGGDGFNIGAAIPCGASCETVVSGAHLMWGSGNTGSGVAVNRGSVLTYQTNVPIVTGTAADFKLAGASVGSSFDTATGTISAKTIATTWAQMAAAVGAAGFGGNAHDFERNTHIVIRN